MWPHVLQLLQKPLFGVTQRGSLDMGHHHQPLPPGAEGGLVARGITGVTVLPEGLTQEQSWPWSSWCILKPLNSRALPSPPQGSV